MTSLGEEFLGPTPQIAVADADAAIAFYRKAFGADELVRNHAPDGRVMHSELLICGGRLLVVDEFEKDMISAPTRLGGTTMRLHLYVADVDTVYQRALDAGATSLHPPGVAFLGGSLRDDRGSDGACLVAGHRSGRPVTWRAEPASTGMGTDPAPRWRMSATSGDFRLDKAVGRYRLQHTRQFQPALPQ